jgi:hypothetical protein
VELMVILKNLAPVGRRGESCVRTGVDLRVVVWGLLVRPPSVRLLEGSADEGP